MIISFLITAIIIELTPGPNMIWIAMVSSVRGAAAAFTAIAGITLGLIVAATVSIFGISLFISTNSWAFESLRYVGFFYLLYLAWDAGNISNLINSKQSDKLPARYFIQGFFTNAFNPKAYLVYAITIPQFAVSEVSISFFSQYIMLSIIYISIATVIHIIIVLSSGIFRKYISSADKIKLAGNVFSILLIFAALWFLYVTRVKY